MRRHPVVISIVVIFLLGSAWFFIYESGESDQYNTELSFDLVRMVAAMHQVHKLAVPSDGDPALEREREREREWNRIRFILSRWEAEQNPSRREIIKLMKRAVSRESTFNNDYMQQYSGRIVMTDIGRGEENFPLYRATYRLMHDNILGLSRQEQSAVALFADTIFSEDLAQVRQAHPDRLAQGETETLVAAFTLQDFAH